MPKFRIPHKWALPHEEFLSLLARLKSDRRVKPITSVSGHLVRGNFPSRKAPLGARFQSLVEEDFLRVLEVAPSVRVLMTHSVVLNLPCGEERVPYYTPDVQVHTKATAALVEVKAEFFLTQPESRARIAATVHRLRINGLSLALVLDADIRQAGLQEELKELLRLRPVVPRYRPRLDAGLWDPLRRNAASDEIAGRWAAAQAECEALLARVMRRDPDELIDAYSR